MQMASKSHKAMGDNEWHKRLQDFADNGIWPSSSGNRPAPRQKKWNDLYLKVTNIQTNWVRVNENNDLQNLGIYYFNSFVICLLFFKYIYYVKWFPFLTTDPSHSLYTFNYYLNDSKSCHQRKSL